MSTQVYKTETGPGGEQRTMGVARCACGRVVEVTLPEEGLITTEEVAERMSAAPATVWRLKNRGVLGHYRLGVLVRYKWSEVVADLERWSHVGGMSEGEKLKAEVADQGPRTTGPRTTAGDRELGQPRKPRFGLPIGNTRKGAE